MLRRPRSSFGQGSQTWQVVEYYDTDAVGSIRSVTDAQGQVVARHDFLPFGEELSPQAPPHDKHLFTGQERDFDTGQDNFTARHLRTDLGRFLAPDPITLVPRVVGSQGLNAYAYTRNNPLRFIDPNGLDPRYFADKPYQYGYSSPTDLPEGAVFDQMGATDLLTDLDYRNALTQALAASVNPVVKDEIERSVGASDDPAPDVGDRSGGFHETGGMWGVDASGNIVAVPCVPGQAADPLKTSEASIDTARAADPNLAASLRYVDGQWHVHPSGWKFDENTRTIRQFQQPPSTTGRAPDTANGTLRVNIVVGATNKTVYFYNTTGQIGVSMSLSAFLRR